MDWQTKRKKKGKFAFVFFAVLAGIFLLVALVQYLWNWLVPDIFGFKAISYWQAFGLFVLSKILFGGFGKPKGGFRKGVPHDEGLSPEERERLKAELKRRFDEKCRF
ncbi:hypothetical protein BC792_11325 [Sphingobacterium allocomposti]|jgi:hypothetical protein|uniref:Uncharacterized protein n=1 Tax=Sphingobacterium allocomposti TaxID=415956 RepID=A0A5S5DDQ7_9SPHI|nr:hypothetical protein [Sphingobacterium composti Yoo et al. 2007 non Ten et al. 2007]TYP94157.1 hypothetical protein BC792_11325 [Sphingobacterium composti Yoo et al. 2007 non Ten et al. 2007]